MKLILILTVLSVFATDVCWSQTQALPEILPKDLETDLALSALPAHLRADAGLYLLERGGYALIRESSNGFECLVRRSGVIPGNYSDAILPICYDKVGSKSVLQAVIDEVAMLELNMDREEVKSIITERWTNGDYDLPGHGISYMLSPVFRVNGRMGGYVPHLMFYGPYMTDDAVGASDDRFDYVPFVQAPGLPSAVMVAPVGEKERLLIEEAEADLIKRLDEYLAGNESE